jgi:hypothetical protein
MAILDPFKERNVTSAEVTPRVRCVVERDQAPADRDGACGPGA